MKIQFQFGDKRDNGQTENSFSISWCNIFFITHFIWLLTSQFTLNKTEHKINKQTTNIPNGLHANSNGYYCI